VNPPLALLILVEMVEPLLRVWTDGSEHGTKSGKMRMICLIFPDSLPKSLSTTTPYPLLFRTPSSKIPLHPRYSLRHCPPVPTSLSSSSHRGPNPHLNQPCLLHSSLHKPDTMWMTGTKATWRTGCRPKRDSTNHKALHFLFHPLSFFIKLHYMFTLPPQSLHPSPARSPLCIFRN
jgi:hypothetical protein